MFWNSLPFFAKLVRPSPQFLDASDRFNGSHCSDFGQKAFADKFQKLIIGKQYFSMFFNSNLRMGHNKGRTHYRTYKYYFYNVKIYL